MGNHPRQEVEWWRNHLHFHCRSVKHWAVFPWDLLEKQFWIRFLYVCTSRSMCLKGHPPMPPQPDGHLQNSSGQFQVTIIRAESLSKAQYLHYHPTDMKKPRGDNFHSKDDDSGLTGKPFRKRKEEGWLPSNTQTASRAPQSSRSFLSSSLFCSVPMMYSLWFSDEVLRKNKEFQRVQ